MPKGGRRGPIINLVFGPLISQESTVVADWSGGPRSSPRTPFLANFRLADHPEVVAIAEQ
jgi:hypothetical protein